MEGKLQRLVTDMKLNEHVKFLGAIPNKELKDHYAWADIMMHTSLHEGQSGVVMEAMACGVVVCGTRVGIISDLGDEYFLTVAIGDYKALASLVISLSNDKNNYNILQEKAYLWSHEYDSSWTVKKFDLLYRDIVDQDKGK